MEGSFCGTAVLGSRSEISTSTGRPTLFYCYALGGTALSAITRVLPISPRHAV